jgi:quercetin dioxygenase-like cupin family protein
MGMGFMPKIDVLGRMDGPTEGYVKVITKLHIFPGEQVARHTHPGVESTYFLEGEGVVMADGFPDKPCKPGDWFQVPPDVPHSVKIGPDGVVAVGHYIVEKDEPLVTWL